MDEKSLEILFQDLESWANDANDDKPLDISVFTDFKDVILRAVFDHDRENLNFIKDKIGYIGSILRPWVKTTPFPRRQAMEIFVLLTLIGGFLFTMEQDDPVSAAKNIRYGEQILGIILDAQPDELNLNYIQGKLEGGRLSPSTISRVLGALEETGYIRREGATQGRRFNILPKSRTWRHIKQQRVDIKPDANILFEGSSQNINDNPSIINLIQPRTIRSISPEDFCKNVKENVLFH